MTLSRRKWTIIASGSLALAALAGVCAWLLRTPPEPEYSGKRLSVWAEELLKGDHLRNVIDTNRTAVQAVRAIGTNAIPWAVHALTMPPPLGWRLNKLLQKQSSIRYRFPVASEFERQHLRGRVVFWALGEAAEPAIPRLLSIVEREPDLGPSALAGIGAPALSALAYCLSNTPPAASSPEHTKVVANALGGLYVAIDVGRISTPEASYLLPTVREWHTNPATRYWADAVLRQYTGHKRTFPDASELNYSSPESALLTAEWAIMNTNAEFYAKSHGRDYTVESAHKEVAKKLELFTGLAGITITKRQVTGSSAVLWLTYEWKDKPPLLNSPATARVDLFRERDEWKIGSWADCGTALAPP